MPNQPQQPTDQPPRSVDARLPQLSPIGRPPRQAGAAALAEILRQRAATNRGILGGPKR